MDEDEKLKVQRYLEQHVSPIGKRIYAMIEHAPLTKTDLRKRTSLPVKQLDDQLSTLAAFNLIKAIKKPEKKNLNIWVLFHEKEEEEQHEQKTKNEELIELITKKDAPIQQIKKEAIKKSYSLDKFDEILEMLQMGGQISIHNDEVRLRELPKIQVPCITCELKRLCEPGKTISPETCPYLISW